MSEERDPRDVLNALLLDAEQCVLKRIKLRHTWAMVIAAPGAQLYKLVFTRVGREETTEGRPWGIAIELPDGQRVPWTNAPVEARCIAAQNLDVFLAFLLEQERVLALALVAATHAARRFVEES